MAGTLVPIDRLWYPGKHRRNGGDVQFPADPRGELIGPRRPGSVHGLTAAREHGIVDGLTFPATAGYTDNG